MLRAIQSSLLVVLLLAGCTTPGAGRRARDFQQRNDIDALKSRVAQLENRVNDIEAARQRLYEENDALRDSIRKENEKLRSDLAVVQRLIKAVEMARARDKKEIIDSLSKQVSTLLREHQPKQVYQTGREHTIQPGETLSEIARAYGVTVKAIVGANKQLRTANTIIRPGQKLFIPE